MSKTYSRGLDYKNYKKLKNRRTDRKQKENMKKIINIIKEGDEHERREIKSYPAE